MIKKVFNKLFPCKWGRCEDRLLGCNCGTFIGISAGAIGTAALMGGGAAYMLSQDGGGDEDEMQWSMPPDPKWFEQPEYGEAKGARETWWKELQEGYLPEDWGQIWERAKQKYSQYYWGGPGGQPGVAAKVKASAARRGVSESPALEAGLGRMGMEEAAGLRDIDISEITGRMGERQNWLGQISKLANLRMPGMWQTAQGYMPAQEASPWGEIAGAAGSYLGQQGQQDWWKMLFSQYAGGGDQWGGYTPTSGGGVTREPLYGGYPAITPSRIT